MAYKIQVETVAGIPTAVVRRRAHSQELARVVPEACGIVWNVIAQTSEGSGEAHRALPRRGDQS